jgi:hypothetical protein
VPFLQALSAPFAPSGVLFPITDYYFAQGSLVPNFSPASGVFTAPTTGVYLITCNLTYQNNPITINDGTRQVQFVRHWLTPEPSFIGQSVWVTLPESPSGPFYDRFRVMLSASAAIPMPAGGQLSVLSYQDNSTATTIEAFTELEIAQLLVDPPSAPIITSPPIPRGPTP